LLVLDDLGAQSSTPWAKEKLEQLLNHRWNNQLPTVIVSIAPTQDLEERIRTRLVNSDFCQVYELGEKPILPIYGWAPEFKREKEMTFDNFDWKRAKPMEVRENLERAFHLALDFAKSPDDWLVFQGVNGCGKTHLAAAIVNYRYKMREPALFVVVPDFLDHLRSTFSPESRETYDQFFESVKNTPLLVLDDFGKQTTASWAQEKLYQLINYRYNARLPTVVTTNMSTDEMDNSISWRFADPKISTLFHIIAPNYYAGTREGATPWQKGV
jgi:DNA replication protein DnaC